MAVYIVTGKLGAGKTLLVVQKIQEYLKQRRTVAVNIDVHMDKLCKRDNTYSRLIRLPDLPTANDLLALEFGCEHYDEEKFGGIFLDEAGVWLNSRDWNQGGRTDLLKFFLFLRKRRWDLWLCVQNVNVIDKQIRESIAEHVVYINRLDRMKLPFPFGFLGRVLSLGMWKGNLPKLHQAVVRYGAKANSPKADDWFYRGEDFYSFYDTTQEYNKEYDKGSYSMLPPGYLKKTPMAQRNWGFFMRLTKIFFRRTKVIHAFLLGFIGAAVISAVVVSALQLFSSPDDSPIEQPVKVSEKAEVEAPTTALKDEFADLVIRSYADFSGQHYYVFANAEGKRITSEDLKAQGVFVMGQGTSKVQLIRKDDTLFIYR